MQDICDYADTSVADLSKPSYDDTVWVTNTENAVFARQASDANPLNFVPDLEVREGEIAYLNETGKPVDSSKLPEVRVLQITEQHCIVVK